MFSKALDFHDFCAQGFCAHGTLMPIGFFMPINDKKQMDRFDNLQLLSPNAKIWTNYLRRGSVISSYGPCGHFGCGSLFKAIVKCLEIEIF